MKEIVFATVAGLRGSVSLILAQAVVVDPSFKPSGPGDVETIVSFLAHDALSTKQINLELNVGEAPGGKALHVNSLAALVCIAVLLDLLLCSHVVCVCSASRRRL